jgi:hypothetical protein
MNGNNISPVPYQEQIVQGAFATFTWLEWFRQLRDFVVGFNAYKTYGMFACTNNQTPTAVNTPQVIQFDTQPITDGITYTGSKITVPNTGLYRFTFSCQVTSTSSSAKNVWFWPRVNGVDVPGSTIKSTMLSNNSTGIVTRSGLFRLNAGDYLESWWAADKLDVQLTAFSATSFAPATPAVLLEALQIG